MAAEDDKFRLPGSSYEELSRVIQAYGELGRDVSPSEVGSLISKPPTEVSRNNGFLLSLGIVEGSNKKRVTSQGAALSRALHFDLADEVAKYWNEICTPHDFIQKVVSAVRIRRGMTKASLITHIAYTAGQSRTKNALTGANTLVDILVVARVLREADGKLVVTGTDGHVVQIGTATERDEALPIQPAPATRKELATPSFEAEPGAPASQLVIHVHVNVNCSPEELSSVIGTLQALGGQHGFRSASEE